MRLHSKQRAAKKGHKKRAGAGSKPSRRSARRAIEHGVPFECQWCGDSHIPYQTAAKTPMLMFYCCERLQVGRIGSTDYTQFPPVGWERTT